MDFDEFELWALSANSQEAFATFEATARKKYEKDSFDDRNNNFSGDGEYHGRYEPERTYVTSILAFLDEYQLEVDVADILDLDEQEFLKEFEKFRSKTQYMTMRFEIRKARIGSGSVGTLIEIPLDYKSEIGKHLETIRRIVNQKIEAGRKKDSIFSKIASLQSEVDRDQTTVDAAFGFILDLGKTLGQAGKEMKPAVDQLERVKKLFWDKSEKVPQLPKQDRPKLITKDGPPAFRNDLDDEIPF